MRGLESVSHGQHSCKEEPCPNGSFLVGERVALAAVGRLHACKVWVADKELKLSYHSADHIIYYINNMVN